MKIKLIPQVTMRTVPIDYKFDKDFLIVTIDGVTDTFDFHGMPNGSMDTSTVQTDLPVNPFCDVRKSDGVLYLELLYWTPADMSIPDRWLDHDNYVAPWRG